MFSGFTDPDCREREQALLFHYELGDCGAALLWKWLAFLGTILRRWRWLSSKRVKQFGAT